MAYNPFRRGPPGRRAYIVRVSSPGTAVRRFAVLSHHSGQAMASVVADLDPCDVAELTDEVLDPAIAASLGLEPDRPCRLTGG